MEFTFEAKDISRMYVQCAFKVRNLDSGVTCMSDCCGVHAEYAVDVDGALMYRCAKHKELIAYTHDYFEKGNYTRTIMVRKPVEITNDNCL